MPKKPKLYKKVPTPSFKTTLEKQRYWANEKVKWLEGYAGLSGMHYHFIQEQMVKHRVTGKVFNPRTLEADILTYNEIEEARKNFTPVLIIKARGTRFSTFGGAATNYFMRAYPGSTSLVTSADQSRISKLYLDKIKVCHENYHPDIQYDIVSRSETKNSTYFRIAINYLDNGKVKVAESDIFCNQTNSSDSAASSFSGTGSIFGFYDEIALNPRRDILLQSSESCYIDPDTSERTGLLVMGGTVEHTLTSEDLANFIKLYNSSLEKGYKVIFLPYWYRFHDEEGYLDKDAAEQWYEREYNNKKKSSDPNDLLAFLKNNPSKMEDIFSLGGTDFFSEQAVSNLQNQRERIILLKEQPVPHRLVSVNQTMTEAVPDKNGLFLIKEHPKSYVKYNMVIDGVATGSEYGGDSNSSKVAAVIIKSYDPDTNYPFETVASMEYRPKSLDQVFPNILDFARYYNKYNGFQQMHPEASNSTHELLPRFMLKEGCIHWVKNRVDYSRSGWVDTKKYGQPMNNYSIAYAVGRWNEILSKHPEVISMNNIIEDMLKPSTENADLRSAMLLYAFMISVNYEKPPTINKKTYALKARIVYKNGKSEFVFEKVPVT